MRAQGGVTHPGDGYRAGGHLGAACGPTLQRRGDTPRFEQLLGDGSQWGLELRYAIQPSPDGLAQAFLIGEQFIGDDHVALVLGDNIFYGHDFHKLLEDAHSQKSGATVFAYHVQDPERYGVVSFDGEGRAMDLEEKPARPQSSYAVTGLYFYDPQVTVLVKP